MVPEAHLWILVGFEQLHRTKCLALIVRAPNDDCVNLASNMLSEGSSVDEVQADDGRIYVARFVPSGRPHSSRRLMLSAGTGTPQGSTEYDLK